MNRACVPKEKHQNSQKMGEIHELFVLALSLVWFAGATPEKGRLGGSKKQGKRMRESGQYIGGSPSTSLVTDQNHSQF